MWISAAFTKNFLSHYKADKNVIFFFILIHLIALLLAFTNIFEKSVLDFMKDIKMWINQWSLISWFFFTPVIAEVIKLRNHLSLLREEYVKLQNKLAEVERKYQLSAATSGQLEDDNFVARLLRTVADLFNKAKYR